MLVVTHSQKGLNPTIQQTPVTLPSLHRLPHTSYPELQNPIPAPRG